MLEILPQQPATSAAQATSAKALNAKPPKDGADTRADTGGFAKALEQANSTQSDAAPGTAAATAAPTEAAPGVETLAEDIALEASAQAEPANDGELASMTPEHVTLEDMTIPALAMDKSQTSQKITADAEAAEESADAEQPSPTLVLTETSGNAAPVSADTGNKAVTQTVDAEDGAIPQSDQIPDGTEAVVQAQIASATTQPLPQTDKKPAAPVKAAASSAPSNAQTAAAAHSQNTALSADAAGSELAASRYTAQVEDDSALDEKLVINQAPSPTDKVELKSTTASFEKLLAAQTEANPADPALTVSLSKAPSGESPAVKPLPEVMVQVPQQRAEMAAKQVGLELARQAKNGDTHFVIRMDPPELGKLDVRLTINKAGEVQANILVDREGTLDLLARDARALERTLQDAGLKFDQSSLNLSLKQNSEDGQGKSLADAKGRSAASDDADAIEDLLDGATLAQIQLASGRPLDVVI